MKDIDLSPYNLNHDMNATINGVLVSTILKKAVVKRKNGKTGLPLKRQLLVTFALRDGLCCTYCKRPVDFLWMGDFEFDEVATFEHLRPNSQGGELSEENGEIACEPCNGNRSDQPIEAFLMKMADGFYVEDEVKFRKIVKNANRRAANTAAYRIRVKKRRRKAIKLLVDNTLRTLYNTLSCTSHFCATLN